MVLSSSARLCFSPGGFGSDFQMSNDRLSDVVTGMWKKKNLGNEHRVQLGAEKPRNICTIDLVFGILQFISCEKNKL